MNATKIDIVRGWEGVPGWLAPGEAAVLRAAVLSTAPGTAIVELGRWCGRSLIALAAARAEQDLECPWCVKDCPHPCEACRGTGRLRRPLISFDSYPAVGQAQEAAADTMQITPSEAKALSYSLTSAFGIQDVYLIDDDAIKGASEYGMSTFRYMLDGDFKIGCLYVDDDHSGERVIAELEAWEPHLADECEVCMHDYGHEPYGIEPAVDRWMLNHPEWVMIEFRLGMARMRRRWKATPRAAAEATRIVEHNGLGFAWTGAGDIIHRANRPTPLLSVLYNTWRLGGLDCLKEGLAKQTADPESFEVVIVDALYPYRREAVRRYFADAPYVVKHVNPTDNPFPRDHGNRARNDAIQAAEGKVLVWWCDYSIAEPESLERHYSKVVRSGWRGNSCGHIIYGHIAEQALHPAFRVAVPFRTIDDYVEFVEGLPSDSPLWTTIFTEEPRALGRKGLICIQRNGHAQPYEFRDKVLVSSVVAGPFEIARDVRRDYLNGPSPTDQVYYAKNEATARAVLLEINGWEESFDDGHASDDLDICRRLGMAGSTMVLDNGNECFVPNPRPFFPLMRWKRTPKENRKLFEVLESIGRPRAIQGIVNELDQIPKPETTPEPAKQEVA